MVFGGELRVAEQHSWQATRVTEQHLWPLENRFLVTRFLGAATASSCCLAVLLAQALAMCVGRGSECMPHDGMWQWVRQQVHDLHSQTSLTRLKSPSRDARAMLPPYAAQGCPGSSKQSAMPLLVVQPFRCAWVWTRSGALFGVL
mmetsp:Transcript_35175/g.70151  ORF Transcript_35175/g.70151 Transcript_35175/m.70151 type:complete len:145 (-) Transcript_35175:30-464(-)